MAIFLRLLLLGLSVLISQTAHADPQSKSFSNWQFNGQQATATYTIANREVTRLPDYQFNPKFSEVMAEHINKTVALSNNDQLCELSELQSQRAANGYTQLEVVFDCSEAIDKATILIATLLDAAPSHVHFAKFQHSDGNPFELLFTRRQASHALTLSGNGRDIEVTGSSDTFLTYIVFGFEHILIGVDHIAFLLTLMLLARGLKDILWVITGFTIGHSITLSLAVLKIATPNTMVVEALIGFTIALVAIENIACQTRQSRKAGLVAGCVLGLLLLLSALRDNGPPLLSLFGLAIFSYCYLNLSHSKAIALRMRPLITLGFGMVHGFGFANVLMEVGLPAASIMPALFGFNLGVELGQVAIVLVIAVIAWLLFKVLALKNSSLFQEALSAGLCGLGVFWFVQRGWF